jgi:uncharacterized membrane protein YhaH (DUF805 family)
MKETNVEEHIINCFNKFATFEGKASKSEFWYFFLFYVIAQVISYFIDLNVFDAEDGFGIITILVNTILFLPMLAVGARRLHDANKSGWWQLLMLTGIGSIPLMIMWCIDGSTKSYVEDNSSPSNRTKSIPADKDSIQVFDAIYERKDYVNRFLIEHAKAWNEGMSSSPEFKKIYSKNYKWKFEISNKYWNTENIYPNTQDEFIDRYLSNRKLDPLEGVWDEEKWGLVGVVKEKSFYQVYDVDITQKSYDKFQKKHIDYSFVSGTKGGAFFSTTNQKKFKTIGRAIIVQLSNPAENPGTEEKSYAIHSINGELKVVNDNHFILNFTDHDQRKVNYGRVWPLDIKEYNKDFQPTLKSQPKLKKSNIAKELKDLKELYNDGTLSKEEFSKAKSKLLN